METKPENNEISHAGLLPVPDAAALEHTRRLQEKIWDEITTAGGKISFRRYMEMALYEPGLGYYSAGARKFGPEGDFTTAPELSELYSRCIARQCLEILDHTKGGSIMELGAGSGVMASAVLTELSNAGHLPENYLILETSADLRQRQQQLLASTQPGYYSHIVWLDRLPSKPFSGVILASEVLDALPVHRIVFDSGGISLMAVVCESGCFSTIKMRPQKELLGCVEKLRAYFSGTMPETYTTELNTELEAWLATFADVLEHGVMLIVDYGYPGREYYHPQRRTGTLKCHYRHHVHDDPFFYPGLQDITASVDFTGLAELALAAGLEVMGYTTQAYFLLACGLSEMLTETNDNYHRLELTQQAKLLTMPGEMGEQFKVMALGKSYSYPLRGFSLADQRGRL